MNGKKFFHIVDNDAETLIFDKNKSSRVFIYTIKHLVHAVKYLYNKNNNLSIKFFKNIKKNYHLS